jgi:hypothetical protein
VGHFSIGDPGSVLHRRQHTCASAASGAEIDSLAWNRSNLKTLRAFDEAAVLRFLDSLSDSRPSIDSVAGDIEEHTIERPDPESGDSSLPDLSCCEFGWQEAGDGKYELAVASSTGPEISFLTIYWQEASHKVRSQSFDMPPYSGLLGEGLIGREWPRLQGQWAYFGSPSFL